MTSRSSGLALRLPAATVAARLATLHRYCSSAPCAAASARRALQAVACSWPAPKPPARGTRCQHRQRRGSCGNVRSGARTSTMAMVSCSGDSSSPKPYIMSGTARGAHVAAVLASPPAVRGCSVVSTLRRQHSRCCSHSRVKVPAKLSSTSPSPSGPAWWPTTSMMMTVGRWGGGMALAAGEKARRTCGHTLGARCCACCRSSCPPAGGGGSPLARGGAQAGLLAGGGSGARLPPHEAAAEHARRAHARLVAGRGAAACVGHHVGAAPAALARSASAGQSRQRGWARRSALHTSCRS